LSGGHFTVRDETRSLSVKIVPCPSLLGVEESPKEPHSPPPGSVSCPELDLSDLGRMPNFYADKSFEEIMATHCSMDALCLYEPGSQDRNVCIRL